MIFYLCIFYWHSFCIIYFGRFQLTIFATIWFFATDRENLLEPLENAFEWIFRFHYGSVVLAALLLPLVSVIQLPVSYIQSTIEELARGSMLIGFVSSCTECIEGLFLCVNSYGLMKTALDGSSFFVGCTSAKRDIVKKNNLRYGALAEVVDVALILLNFLVAGIVVFIFDIFMNNSSTEKENKLEDHTTIIVSNRS